MAITFTSGLSPRNVFFLYHMAFFWQNFEKNDMSSKVIVFSLKSEGHETFKSFLWVWTHFDHGHNFYFRHFSKKRRLFYQVAFFLWVPSVQLWDWTWTGKSSFLGTGEACLFFTTCKFYVDWFQIGERFCVLSDGERYQNRSQLEKQVFCEIYGHKEVILRR